MGGLYPRGPIDCGVQFVLDSKIDIFFLRKQLFITFDVILSWNTFENRKDESFKCYHINLGQLGPGSKINPKTASVPSHQRNGWTQIFGNVKSISWMALGKSHLGDDGILAKCES